jgi:DNA-binding beta-propeller fold protein YncE
MTILDTTPPAVREAATPLDPNEGEAVPEATAEKSKRWKITLLIILLLIFALLVGWYLLHRKPLSELPGLSRAKVPHYEFSIYGTSHPLGVAVTPSGGRIYVTDTDGDRLVRVFDHSGKSVGTLKPPASTGASHAPVYAAINPKTNTVYVSDRLTSSVYIYDAKGAFVRAFAPKAKLDGGWAPLGLAFDPDGNLYVTDVRGPTSATHRVLVFGPDGTLLRTLGSGALSFPNGIVVDPRGNVDVSDSNNGRLVIFNPAGKVTAAINRGIGEGDLGMPRGTAIDDSGRLFVVDTADHMLRVYSLGSSKHETPKYIGSVGGEGQVDGRFEYPNGVATDVRAHIYVTDRENNRVQVWGY